MLARGSGTWEGCPHASPAVTKPLPTTRLMCRAVPTRAGLAGASSVTWGGDTGRRGCAVGGGGGHVQGDAAPEVVTPHGAGAEMEAWAPSGGNGG